MEVITNRQSRTVFFLFCSMYFCVPATAQTFKEVRETADKFVRSKRPDLKLERKIEKEKEAVYVWRSAEDGVEVLSFQGNSREEAIERMQAFIKFLPVGPGTKRNDIGEEAYSWQSANTDFAGIRFRKDSLARQWAACLVMQSLRMNRDYR